LSYARDQGLKTGIATNGLLVDEAMAHRIRDAGVLSVQISLDGLERTHNAIRHHPQSFARAARAVDLLNRLEVPLVSVSSAISPRNLSELGALRDLVTSLGVSDWRLTVIMPIGRGTPPGMVLSEHQLRHMLDFAVASKKKQVRVHVGDNLPYLGKWEKRVRSAPVVCPVGFVACCIGVDGHVRGCPEMPDTAEYREGSVVEQSLSDIWQRGFARYRERSLLETDTRCARCHLRERCYGGCWVMREGGRHCIRDLLA
jgi:radical SAM protein with 4Fe4S-binding SPASM domain